MDVRIGVTYSPKELDLELEDGTDAAAIRSQVEAALNGGELLNFSSEALDALLAWRWPGNVRELKNLMERLHVLAHGRDVGLRDLPAELVSTASAPELPPNYVGDVVTDKLDGTLVDAERQMMKNALAAEGGNLSRVAQRLGISRPTLYRKLDRYGIRRGFV